MESESNGRVAEENDRKPAHAPRTPSPLQQQQKHNSKATKILEACKWNDIEALRTLATSEGGLVSDDFRRQAWPLLLGFSSRDGDVKPEDKDFDSWKKLPKHRDEDQVQLDVNRSFIYYPNDQSTKELDHRKEELSDLITEVLRRHQYLCYFQGYHDICQVFLLVLKPQNRAAAVARLSALRIRDFMLPTLAPALAQLRLIPAIIYAVEPKLWSHLSQTQPFFALSGTLTMYAHDIQEYGDIARLFDVFLAREAVFSVYMFAQIVLQRSDELFETPAEEPEMLHSILSKLPKPLNLEALIQNTVKLFEKLPPEKLNTWWSISHSSVLKTARSPDQVRNQSLEDGEVYFKKQVQEMEWADQREKIFKVLWKYRRPAGTIGMAVLVGVISFWARKSTGPPGILGELWKKWSSFRGF
ncbi:GTPase-activating protein gyp10 [Lachnellula suecica]|uniref:GTPase-activating protein gyp10 n=1 Tax=Lachnellula suecica TaxID=602035 RepID=A0A8T9C4G4_9HELO|nr:GTPase-activating protein gyp10 [Lachnellula suecica]